jgi:hypothetical protein
MGGVALRLWLYSLVGSSSQLSVGPESSTAPRTRPASSIPPTVTVVSFTDNRQCRLSMMTFVLASVLVLKQGER